MRGFFFLLLLLIHTTVQAEGTAFVASFSEQPSANFQDAQIRVGLVADFPNWQAGQSQWLALSLRPEPGWHTYWKNPGDSGAPPKVTWTLPPGFTVGEPQWMNPQAIPFPPLVNYGYKGDSMLLFPLQVDASVGAGPHTLTADVRWLVCAEVCIPGEANLSLTASGVADVQMERVLPQPFMQALAEHPAPWSQAGRYQVNATTIALALPWDAALEPSEVSALFPLQPELINPAGSSYVDVDQDTLRAVFDRSPFLSAPAAQTRFRLVTASGQSYLITAQLDGIPAASGLTPALPAHETAVNLTLGLLLAAFAGGLILNLMPCVLPVLSLKALSFARHSRPAGQGLAYGAGVLLAMLSLGALLLGLRAAGAATGWGFQLQNPALVAGLVYLFFILGLAFLQAFPLPGLALSAGSQLADRPGLSGSFMTGVLAVLVASPCTAPFMGAALGAALVLPPQLGLLIFLALGLGLAAPMVLLALLPQLRDLLPRPGPWMLRLQQILAFPMFATSAWLLVVLSEQQGSAGIGLALAGLIILGMLGWCFQQGLGRRALWASALTGLTLLTLIMQPYLEPAAKTSASQQADSVSWSPEKLQRARAADQVVLVNMTATWCITCKVNERITLAHPEVEKLIEHPRVTYLVGDWTQNDPDISAYLNSFNRAGVPLYAVYAGTQEAQLLPQILTVDDLTGALWDALTQVNANPGG